MRIEEQGQHFVVAGYKSPALEIRRISIKMVSRPTLKLDKC